MDMITCPTCDGTGVRPPEDRGERVALCGDCRATGTLDLTPTAPEPASPF